MPSDLLTKKTKTTKREDRQNVEDFVVAMMERMSSGKKAHSSDVALDPIAEAMQECVDISNYAMIMYVRLATFRKKVEKIADTL